MPSSSIVVIPDDKEVKLHSSWINKSKVDYFACFMELWVGFNSWFKKAYNQNQDRQCINAIKNRELDGGELYSIFDQLLFEHYKEAILFRGNLEALYYTLNAANLRYPDGPKNKAKPEEIEYRMVSFNSIIPDWTKKKYPSGYIDLFHSFSDDKSVNDDYDEEGEDGGDDDFIALDEVNLIYDPELIFAGLIEIIYQIRCQLFHGSLNPDNPIHYSAVKHCYEILLEMASRLKT